VLVLVLVIVLSRKWDLWDLWDSFSFAVVKPSASTAKG
jgi:hypothetical protein